MYRAKVSFSGAIIMKKNEVREIKDKKIVKDLVDAGYIEEYKSASPKELEKENETLKKELQEANDVIEELKNKIAELETPVANTDNDGDKTPNEDGDKTPTKEK